MSSSTIMIIVHFPSVVFIPACTLLHLMHQHARTPCGYVCLHPLTDNVSLLIKFTFSIRLRERIVLVDVHHHSTTTSTTYTKNDTNGITIKQIIIIKKEGSLMMCTMYVCACRPPPLSHFCHLPSPIIQRKAPSNKNKKLL